MRNFSMLWLELEKVEVLMFKVRLQSPTEGIIFNLADKSSWIMHRARSFALSENLSWFDGSDVL